MEILPGKEIITKLRSEPFNKESERRLRSHPYIKAAEAGTLTLSQRRAFAHEQYFIQLSDALSFASLAGHAGFKPNTLTGVSIPVAKLGDKDSVDLFQFLLSGEVYASSLLLEHAKSLGILNEDVLSNPTRSGYQLSFKGQAYPSYWARLALSNNRAAGAAACAVNFPAWGAACNRLLYALGVGEKSEQYKYKGVDDGDLAFIKFFSTPIDNLDEMAADIIEKEGATYEDVVEHVRLLQEYEILFWDAIFEK